MESSLPPLDAWFEVFAGCLLIAIAAEYKELVVSMIGVRKTEIMYRETV